jgi:hypothetical protein
LVLNLVEFFCIYWNDDVKFFFHFVPMMYHIDWQVLNYPCFPELSVTWSQCVSLYSASKFGLICYIKNFLHICSLGFWSLGFFSLSDFGTKGILASYSEVHSLLLFSYYFKKDWFYFFECLVEFSHEAIRF